MYMIIFAECSYLEDGSLLYQKKPNLPTRKNGNVPIHWHALILVTFYSFINHLEFSYLSGTLL